MSVKEAAVAYAQQVVTHFEKPDPQRAKDAARAIRGQKPSLARRLLTAVGDDVADKQLLIEIKQNLAYCTYKDEDLAAPQRYEDAYKILAKYCDPHHTNDTETLGLAGAIHKWMWDYTGRRSDLERALGFYTRAHQLGAPDDGWTSLNTAYVLDLLAAQEEKSGIDAKHRTEAARAIRSEVRERLIANGKPQMGEWWYCASLAEASLGLEDFAAAEAALERGKNAKPSMLDEQSTARQLSNLIRLHFEKDPDGYANAAAVMTKAFGISEVAVRAMVAGKVGLALSGGGFRASLFHIGVLAKLAELDLLRYIEVLSCVSGGSIVGAFYYLELKKRLEKNHGVLTRKDGIELVRDVERKFLAGVQKNIRTTVARNPWAGVRMAFQPNYSRTDRLGALYESLLYDQVPDEGQKPARNMSDLRVAIEPWGTDFNPKYHNWKLDAKVPILVLNATTMNTGHNWQFTATWMGESPSAISTTIDAVPRLRRRWYTETWKDETGAEVIDTKDIPIGRAVGASSCVPGLFAPIVLSDYYEDHTVSLVDGGVHDNQGLTSLIEQGCRVILASDASGQLFDDKAPSNAVGNVVGRSSEISQARVREAEFDQLQALHRAGAIQGSMFIHLTKDLDADPVHWVGAPDKPQKEKELPPKTSYGVDRKIQEQLSHVRTDLDSFSDAEAYALMTSGYLMTHQALVVNGEQCVPTLPIQDAPESWAFLGTRDALSGADAAGNARMKKLLGVSNQLALKIFRLWLPQQLVARVKTIGIAVAAIALFAVLFARAGEPLRAARAYPPFINVVYAALGVLAFVALLRITKKRTLEFALGIIVATGLCAAAWVHLLVFDKLFLRYGRWDKAPEPPLKDFGGTGPKMTIKSGPSAPAPAREVPPRDDRPRAAQQQP